MVSQCFTNPREQINSGARLENIPQGPDSKTRPDKIWIRMHSQKDNLRAPEPTVDARHEGCILVSLPAQRENGYSTQANRQCAKLARNTVPRQWWAPKRDC